MRATTPPLRPLRPSRQSGGASPVGAKALPGEEGIWVLVFGDLAIFAAFFATYAYFRRTTPESYLRDQGSLDLVLGTTNTVLLLSSSLAVALGVQAARSGYLVQPPRFFAVAVGCGCGFVAVKAVEWSHLIGDGKTLSGGGFFQYYFIFTGIHLLHVVIGCLVLGWMVKSARTSRLGPQRMMLIECGGIWWHTVDLLWIVLFALFYLLR